MSINHLSGRQFRNPIEKMLPWLRLVLLSIAVVIVLRAGLARAESTQENTPTSTSSSMESSAQVKVTRDARGRKVQHIDFNETTIEGKARTPDGFVIQSRTPGRFKSLIELRSHFRDNIKVHALEASSAVGLGD
ncbi:MAG: hypothetical protein RI953_2230 [Pseudomonadota bacterium]|jgi:hypothetical protein